MLRSTPLALSLTAALAGCCLDAPDLCGTPLVVDAGVPDDCWSAGRAPLRTASSVDAPPAFSLLGCHRVADGWCTAGLVGEQVDGPRAYREHAPAGSWVTTARGHGCPGALCAQRWTADPGHPGADRAHGRVLSVRLSPRAPAPGRRSDPPRSPVR